MAVLAILYRVLLPFVGTGLAVTVTVIFAFAIHDFDKLHLKAVAGTSYAGLVMFLVACLLVVCITIFCSIVFDKVHRVFLMVVTLSFCVALGGLTLFLFNVTDTIFGYVEELWDEDMEALTSQLEQMFNCEGFNFQAIDTNDTTNCATVIRRWVDEKTKGFGKVVEICWCVLVAGTLSVCILSCRKDESDYGNMRNEASLDRLNDKVGGLSTAADGPDL
jgi:hypothetical protein